MTTDLYAEAFEQEFVVVRLFCARSILVFKEGISIKVRRLNCPTVRWFISSLEPVEATGVGDSFEIAWENFIFMLEGSIDDFASIIRDIQRTNNLPDDVTADHARKAVEAIKSLDSRIAR